MWLKRSLLKKMFLATVLYSTLFALQCQAGDFASDDTWIKFGISQGEKTKERGFEPQYPFWAIPIILFVVSVAVMIFCCVCVWMYMKRSGRQFSNFMVAPVSRNSNAYNAVAPRGSPYPTSEGNNYNRNFINMPSLPNTAIYSLMEDAPPCYATVVHPACDNSEKSVLSETYSPPTFCDTTPTAPSSDTWASSSCDASAPSYDASAPSCDTGTSSCDTSAPSCDS